MEPQRMEPGRSEPGRACVVHSESLANYSFGAEHPMGPHRVRAAIELARMLGVLDAVDIVEPWPADDALVELVHDRGYLDAVRAERLSVPHGLGTEDNPIFPGMHDVASQVAAATVTAAHLVHSGTTRRAANIAGGLHHAMPAAASGFCVYNDAAIAIRWLQRQGVGKIAYLDIDAHHGDGVQKVFHDDPSVLTISLHESPVHLFPGTGFASETGGPDARGSAVNVALPATTGDGDWHRAFDAIVPDVLEAFAPEILITQQGCDAHASDPLTDLRLSVEGLAESYRKVGELADAHAGGRWVALGGGGYAREVVGRAWAHLLGVLAGRPIDPGTETPPQWRRVYQEKFGGAAPERMGDGAQVTYDPVDWGFNPASRLDQAIIATRRAVYPELGLDPGL